MTIVKDRVQRGATWLDQIIPGWREKIDLKNLNIDSGYYCVLGQLGRNLDWLEGYRNTYQIFLKKYLRLERWNQDDQQLRKWVIDHGFLPDPKLDDVDELNKCWERIITK